VAVPGLASQPRSWRVDHVVIAAGTIVNGRIVDNDLANLRRIIDERIWGVTYVVRHATPRMTQGSITFTSGGLSSRPRLGTAMLTAALAGVEALAPALALELAPVRVMLSRLASLIRHYCTIPTGLSAIRL